MNLEKTAGLRALKKRLAPLLLQDDFNAGLAQILELPGQRVINPLFSFFYNKNELLKWRSITAMGLVTGRIAENRMESARVVMRRLMWNLNDESGGMGWGSPEAMGDIMAVNEKLALEFHKILISYLAEDENYLEHEILQRGVLWGVGRLAHVRPHYAAAAAPHLNPFMNSTDPVKRGLAAWAAGPLKNNTNAIFLKTLADDAAEIQIYRHGFLEPSRICDLVRIALLP